jgi:hypothetical protein
VIDRSGQISIGQVQIPIQISVDRELELQFLDGDAYHGYAYRFVTLNITEGALSCSRRLQVQEINAIRHEDREALALALQKSLAVPSCSGAVLYFARANDLLVLEKSAGEVKLPSSAQSVGSFQLDAGRERVVTGERAPTRPSAGGCDAAPRQDD